MNDLRFESNSVTDTEQVGSKIASQLHFPCCVYLNGEMGAGKTTLSKAIINSLGYAGEVTSPTYNLIQEYKVDQGMVYHMDLYRLNDPQEIEYLAIEDLWSEDSIFLIEWAERGQGYLRPCNFQLNLFKSSDQYEFARQFVLQKMV